MALKKKPHDSAFSAPERGDVRPVLSWFSGRAEIPLVAPPRFREYGPLADDPERSGMAFPDTSVEGLAFGIEYLDLRGWLSTRTVRCLALNPARPGLLRAFCSVRKTVRTFRLDRIVATTNLRSGVSAQGGSRLVLLAPSILPDDPTCLAFSQLRDVTRSGVFILLSVAMGNGRLASSAREVVLDHVLAEARHRGMALPPIELIMLWLENLSPGRDLVLAAVQDILRDKDATIRLLPRLLEITRAFGVADTIDGAAMRELIAAIRGYFRPASATAGARELIARR